MHSFFEEIQKHLDLENAFAVYRKPNTTIIKAVFQNDAALNYVQDFTETGFVFAPFNGLENAILIRPNKKNETNLNSKKASKALEAKPEAFSTADAKEFHINLVANGIKTIQNSNFVAYLAKFIL